MLTNYYYGDLLSIRWAGHVECMRQEMHNAFWWGDLTPGRNCHLEDLEIDGKLILQCTLKN
jgi:hypothetical protein